MSKHLKIPLLLGACLLTGCRNGESTDPSKLAPLTDKDMEEIRQRDVQVEEQERGTPYLPPSKAMARGQRTTR